MIDATINKTGSFKFKASKIGKDTQELAEQGKTPMFISENTRLYGALAVADPLKEDSKSAIFSLKNIHLEVTMITAIQLSKATMRNIKQNLFGSFFNNTLGVPVAAGILYPFFGLLLTPIIALQHQLQAV